jgi:hypothetical protein
MGGNALKNCATRRYQAEEYHHLSFEVAYDLMNRGLTCTRIPSYFSKESHGDLDMLVKSSTLPPNWTEKIVEWFAPKEYVKNGNVLSFEYKEFQVDLIATPDNEWLSSFQYFAFNDLGNLIGRVAHSRGLKLGHDGLTYKFFGDNERHLFKEIHLLGDWKDILPVLGYDYERWEKGFDTLEDIFEFVVSSPFFNKSIYALENRNHAARTRDQKRKTYMEFLKWLESYQETDAQIHHSKTSKEDWLTHIMLAEPNFGYQYQETAKEYEQAQEYKKRFNGELVSQWTGLKTQELGKFMKWLKAEREETRWKKDIVALNPELVERLVVYYYEKYKGTLEG